MTKKDAMRTTRTVTTDEVTLKLNTRAHRVQPGQSARYTNRPQRPPFLWQRFEIKDPELWMILDVAIGNCSLFKQNPSGGMGVSAQRLNEEGLLCKDVCQVAQDFSIVALYIGTDPEGAEFDCKVIGRVPR
jgi:hypothetical protein